MQGLHQVAQTFTISRFPGKEEELTGFPFKLVNFIIESFLYVILFQLELSM
jgi:hypothetical protein